MSGPRYRKRDHDGCKQGSPEASCHTAVGHCQHDNTHLDIVHGCCLSDCSDLCSTLHVAILSPGIWRHRSRFQTGKRPGDPSPAATNDNGTVANIIVEQDTIPNVVVVDHISVGKGDTKFWQKEDSRVIRNGHARQLGHDRS
jgi:hypothetical protein